MTREVRSENFEFDHAGQRKHVTIEVLPLGHAEGARHFLVTFVEFLAQGGSAFAR